MFFFFLGRKLLQLSVRVEDSGHAHVMVGGPIIWEAKDFPFWPCAQVFFLVLKEGRRAGQQITNVSGIHQLIDWSHDFFVGLHIVVMRLRVEQTWRLSSS